MPTRSAGAALPVASAATRWGIFHAGLQSADDPKYTVVPQRQRLRENRPATGTPTTSPAPGVDRLTGER